MAFTTPNTKLQQWISVFAKQISDLETAAFQVFTQMNVDDATGDNLDVFGQIVGVEREGRDDDRYRVLIKTQILQNKSGGTAEDLLGILDVLLGPDNDYAITEDSFPAHFEILVNQLVGIVAATVRCTSKGPFVLTDGMTLTISVDGAPDQVVTFNVGDFDDISQARASEIAVVIAADAIGATATSSNDYVYVKTETLGEAGSIQVTGGTANAVLNFPTTVFLGTVANQKFMQSVSDRIQSAKGAGIRGITYWYVCEDQFGFENAVNGVGFDEGCFTSAGD